MKPKIKKADVISKLNYEATALQAQMFHTAYFAHGELTKMVKTDFMASAVIVTITDLSGKVIMKPVAVRDGLSPSTIQALQEDIKRSQKGLKDFDLNKGELIAIPESEFNQWWDIKRSQKGLKDFDLNKEELK